MVLILRLFFFFLVNVRLSPELVSLLAPPRVRRLRLVSDGTSLEESSLLPAPLPLEPAPPRFFFFFFLDDLQWIIGKYESVKKLVF